VGFDSDMISDSVRSGVFITAKPIEYWFLINSLSLSLSLSLARSLALSRSLSLSRALALSLSLVRARTLSLPPSLPPSLPLSLCLEQPSDKIMSKCHAAFQ